MQPADIAAQVAAIFGSVAASGVTVAQEVAAKIIGDLISERLRRDGHEAAWSDFLKDPQNDSLIRYLIREAVQQDQSFRAEIETALQAAASEVPGLVAPGAATIAGSSGAQTGGDTITNSRVAKGGGILQEGKRNTIKYFGDRISIRKGAGASAVVLIICAALVVGVKVVGSLLASPKDGGLTANSTCRQYLDADQENRRQALADIGIAEGLPGYSFTYSYWQVDGACGTQPNAKIGALMKRLGNP
jgi:hypothetical protein